MHLCMQSEREGVEGDHVCNGGCTIDFQVSHDCRGVCYQSLGDPVLLRSYGASHGEREKERRCHDKQASKEGRMEG